MLGTSNLKSFQCGSEMLKANPLSPSSVPSRISGRLTEMLARSLWSPSAVPAPSPSIPGVPSRKSTGTWVDVVPT